MPRTKEIFARLDALERIVLGTYDDVMDTTITLQNKTLSKREFNPPDKSMFVCDAHTKKGGE